MMKGLVVAMFCTLHLASCWPVEEFKYFETQEGGREVLTLTSHGTLHMNQKTGSWITPPEDSQLWFLDTKEKPGCLRSKTAKHLCLGLESAGPGDSSVSMVSEADDEKQIWTFRDDGVMEADAGLVLDTGHVHVKGKQEDGSITQKWRFVDP